MINTLTSNQAVTELLKDEYANWSLAAALALVEWLEELEDSSGEPIEFDPVALRCEWTEYRAADLMEAYSMTLEEVRDRTLVIELGTLTNRSFVVQQF
jgi:hypothetical protein